MNLHAATAGAIERAHYHCLAALWAVSRESAEGFVAFRSELIADAEWNHARIHRAEDLDPQGISGLDDRTLDRIIRWFRDRDRRPAIAFPAAPGSMEPLPAEQWLRDRGWQPEFVHAWVACELETERTSTPEESAADLGVSSVSDPADLDAFSDLFLRVFGGDEGYRRAFHRSLGQSDVRHLLVRRDGQAVAGGTLVRHGHYAGLYNLAVHPDHRRRGLASLVQRWRLHQSLAAGCRVAFLQTEETWVDGWQRRHGFYPLFDLRGWVLEGSRR